MDFFKAQDAARRKTWQLIALFSAAVLALIVLTNLLVGLAATFVAPTTGYSLANYGSLASVPWDVWAMVTTGVVGIVACATVYKYLMVRGGGRSVAEGLGGALLTHDVARGDLHAKRLLNVVEEMAIASGTPVPPVYVLPEQGINAFAAGFTLDDAVIGVNRGTLETLSRDELQGVIAHEFSHILNGDMRVNLRLIAVLHGILFLGLIGRGILRGSRLSSNRKGNGALPIMVIALGLVIIGYGGTFFGKWIKSAVSRQREYLADAASVQFTRNPDGISGALKKIGGSIYGSTVMHPRAEEASHLFFGPVVSQKFRGLFATHPPLNDRILAIEPRWDGEFVVPTEQAPRPTAQTTAGVSSFAGGEAGSIIDSIGEPDVQDIAESRELIAEMEDPLVEAAHEAYAARALIYAMLIQNEQREAQTRLLGGVNERGLAETIDRLLPHLENQNELDRIALIEMSMPSLKSMSARQYQAFMQLLKDLIQSDAKLDLFEWVLYQVVSKELRPHFEHFRPPRTRYRKLRQVEVAASKVLTAIASAAMPDEGSRRALLNEALTSAGLPSDTASSVELKEFLSAAATLRHLHPLQKPVLLKAAVIAAGTPLSARAGAILHGLSACIDCPLPVTTFDDP